MFLSPRKYASDYGVKDTGFDSRFDGDIYVCNLLL